VSRTVFRVLHLQSAPQLSDKLGTLVSIEIVRGSLSDLKTDLFVSSAPPGKWQLTSIAHADPPHPMRDLIALMKISGTQELQVGMQLEEDAEQ
jgi:hypothetical protein